MKIYAGVTPNSNIPDYFHQYSYRVNATIKALEALKNEPYMPTIQSHTVQQSIENEAVYDMDAKDKVIVNTKNLGYNVYDIQFSGLEDAKPITQYDVQKMLDILIKLSEKRFVHGAALPEAFLVKPDGSYILQNVGLLTRRTTQNRFADVFTLYFGFRDQPTQADIILSYLQGASEFKDFSKPQIATIIMNSNPVRFFRFMHENDLVKSDETRSILPYIGIGGLLAAVGIGAGTAVFLNRRKNKEDAKQEDAEETVNLTDPVAQQPADSTPQQPANEVKVEPFSMKDQLQKMVQDAVNKALQREGIMAPPLPRASNMLDISAIGDDVIQSPAGEVDLSRDVTPIQSPRSSRLVDTSTVAGQTFFNMTGMEYDEFKSLGKKYDVSVPELTSDFIDEAGQRYYRVPKDVYGQYVKLLAKHHVDE